MTRNALLLFLAACFAFGIMSGLKYLDSRTIRDLRDREMALNFTANESDKRQATLMAQLATDSVVRDSLARFNERLRLDLEHAKTQRVRIVRVRDSIRATINEDTLSAGLRNLLDLERGVAESFRAELFIERELRKMAEVQVTQLLERQRALQLLVLDLQAQRDSALSLAGDAIDAAAPSFFRSLFQDLPRKAACAGAGAVVVELNDGKVLVGAVVALGVCLAVGGIF